MRLTSLSRVLGGVVLVGALGLAACGDDDEDPARSGDVEETPEATDDDTATGTIEVEGVDYAYEGLPSEIEAGSTIAFHNGSEDEPHEMVVFRLPDGEERTLQELLQLPQAEAEAVTGPPVAVSVAALPGSEGVVVEGAMTFDEPGRYIAICTFPVGTDPQVVAEATGPLPEDPNAGPPHFVQGMAGEFTVS